jgi:GDP-L-fucose synthase
MNRLVVLGGTGFLGQHVMRLLRDQGFDAVSLSRREGYEMSDLTALTARLRDEQPAAVINCAAHVGSVQYVLRHAADVIRDNMQIIMNVYEAVKRACPSTTVIHPISNCSYPGAANIHYEPDWQAGPVHDSVLAYGAPRRMIHAFAESYRRQYAIRSVNWLIANAYGPGDYLDPDRVHALNGIIIRLIKAQRAGERTFAIWGTGKPIREWCYVEDAARIMVQSVGMDEQVPPLNLAQNKGYSIAEIARMVASILEFEVELVFDTRYADGAPFKILDDRLFRAKYPNFEFTPLERGIRNTIAYYRSAL